MSCDGGFAHSRAMEEIARGRNHVTDRVEELRALTEREVLACGDALSSLVDKARELIADSYRHVATSMARSEETMSHFASGMQEDILAQESAVDRVLQLAEGIEKAVLGIEKLTRPRTSRDQLRDRGGPRGRARPRIHRDRQYMRELSGNIARPPRTSLVDQGVRTGLPPVMERATSMTRARTRSSAKSASKSGRHRKSESGAAAGWMKCATLSNVALSHLHSRIRSPEPDGDRMTSTSSSSAWARARRRNVTDAGLVTTTPRRSPRRPGVVLMESRMNRIHRHGAVRRLYLESFSSCSPPTV